MEWGICGMNYFSIIFFMLIFCVFGAGLYFCFEKKNEKEKIYLIRLLRSILNRETITDSEIDDNINGELVFIIKQIQQMYNTEVKKGINESNIIKSLISDLSHQLKTPLTNIALYNEVLEDSKLSEENRSDFVEKISQEAKKIEWLLSSLIKASRLEIGAIEFESSYISIKETLVMGINAVVRQAIEKKIEIIIEEFEDVLLYHNRNWTAEAISNILDNAVKYSAEGSTITISIKRLETFSVIEISDEGIGVLKEEYSKIFQRFYRGGNTGNSSGSGLGLYLARLILLKEKGNVTIALNRKKGTCFKILLQNFNNKFG